MSAQDPPPPIEELADTPLPPRVERKALALLALLALLVAGAALYLMYARGVFEPTQELVLVADDSEGVVVGMNLTFSGFAIGRVRRIELAPDGNARIVIDVPRKDAHWLRQSSVFTLVRGLVGNTNIRAYSGVLTDPPLAPGAERPVLRGDATADIQRLIGTAKELIENLNQLTAAGSPLQAALANMQALTEKLNGPRGALGVLMGNEADARQVPATLARTQAVLARTEALIAKADSQLFGAGGMAGETQAAVVQLNRLLADARKSLAQLDAVLQNAQAVSANARDASADLGTLRAEVEANLRKVEGLLNEVQRKWPFARDAELKLP